MFIVSKQTNRTTAQICTILKYLKLCDELKSFVLYGKIGKNCALFFANYPKKEQVTLLKSLEKKASNGPISQMDAIRFLKKEVYKLGYTKPKVKKDLSVKRKNFVTKTKYFTKQ